MANIALKGVENLAFMQDVTKNGMSVNPETVRLAGEINAQGGDQESLHK